MSFSYHPPASHQLHAGYSHELLRSWQSGAAAQLRRDQLVYPIFIVDDADAKQEIKSMAGQHRWGVNRLRELLEPLVAGGLKSVLLFGVIDAEDKKDDTGSLADSTSSPVVAAIKLIKESYPSLLIMTDVCLCGYTSHGHCGVLRDDGSLDNQASIERLGAMAASHAVAGAHVVAPSDMMDGRIGAIKAALAAAKLDQKCAVMSYSAKFASCMYGPFRDAAHSAPAFGDRRCYQLPAGSSLLAIRAMERDLQEGADFLMVKPAVHYLDVVTHAKSLNRVPVAVYHVSGEFAMLHHAAAAGAFELKRAVLETMQCFVRAGADIVITYFAPLLLEWLPA